jgi:gamma-glutamyltranspeptidase/glutathione hydrolase
MHGRRASRDFRGGDPPMTEVGRGQEFTTRPELQGSFGMVSSTHWLASAAGMRMLELGGNAFDAATAAGFVLQVVQPHLNGPGGDLPAVLWDETVRATEVLCAQGVAPRSATPDLFAALGLDAVPGTGLLAACVPGAIDGWLLLLRDRGTLSLDLVLEPAIAYAGGGYPVSPELTRAISAVSDILTDDWPSSGAIYLASGSVPSPGSIFRNHDLAVTYSNLLNAAAARGGDREARIDAARETFYRGFVAERIAEFLAKADVKDASGRRHRGLLDADDLANWTASWEPAVTRDFHGLTVAKPGAWSQGPVLLQQLAMLEGLDLASLDPSGPDYIHTLVEVSKLAYADREAWYGDPDFADVPLRTLLSNEYARERRGLISASDGSLEQRPGSPDGRSPVMTQVTRGVAAAGTGEPTVTAAWGDDRSPVLDGRTNVHIGDTCHVDVVDRFGNMVSATPSGGWLQSSPVIPGLGFALGTRMQMFDLDPRHPNVLQGGKRPRTTLSPGLAVRDGRPWLAFGTPGGDQQDQWALQFLLRVCVFGDNLQAAIDRPVFHSLHFPSSFYPRAASPGRIMIEDRYPNSTITELARRGHHVQRCGPWSLARMSAVGRGPDGTLRAGANPRGMEGYAVGR